jgi:hypothetical protein
MSKFYLISVKRDNELAAITARAWDRWGILGGPPPSAPRIPLVKRPILIDIIPIRVGNSCKAGTVMCDKNEAKRLIYPKTNRNRHSVWGFVYIPGGRHLIADLRSYIQSSLRNSHGLDMHSEQELIEQTVREVETTEGPILVRSQGIFLPNGLKVVDFYTVSYKEAHSLVYYGKRTFGLRSYSYSIKYSDGIHSRGGP